jgi:hypothetical protein
MMLAKEIAICVNKIMARIFPELFCNKELSATKMYQSSRRKAITIMNRSDKILLINKLMKTKISWLNFIKR